MIFIILPIAQLGWFLMVKVKYIPPKTFMVLIAFLFSQPGWFLVVEVKEVPHHIYKEHLSSHSPLVVFGMLPHEQKMSVVNLVIKSHPQGHFRAIRSKERLIFHVGFRRFANQPIFSEHSTGNKHKVRS